MSFGNQAIMFQMRRILLISLSLVFVTAKINKRLVPLNHGSGLGAMECILNFYQNHSIRNFSYPGAIINVNIFMRVYSESQDLFLKNLADPQRNFFNSTIFIQMAEQNQSKPYQIMPKISKYIVFILNARELEENISSWKITESWNPLAQLFVILHASLSEYQKKIAVKRIYRILIEYQFWQSYLLIIDFDNGFTSALTWCPYKSAKGEIVIDHIEVEKCFFGSKTKSNTMTKNSSITIEFKISDSKMEEIKWKITHGMILKVAARLFPPFVMYVNKTSTKYPQGIFSGAEVYLMNILAKKIKMKSQFNISSSYMYTNKEIANG